VLILKADKVACFVADTQVFILKVVSGGFCGQNTAKRGVRPQVLILQGLEEWAKARRGSNSQLAPADFAPKEKERLRRADALTKIV